MADGAGEKDVDPGGDTEMFRAFVERSESYQPRANSMAPIYVAVGAIGVALIAFLLIIALG